MSLTEQINQDIKQAMKERQKERVEALRAIKTAFTLARTEKAAGQQLSDEEEVKIIQKLVKQREDSAAIYLEQNRKELSENELREAEFIRVYLPAQMSDEELSSYLEELIKSIGARGMKDMGKVMGIATKNLAGKADGKKIASKVRELLG